MKQQDLIESLKRRIKYGTSQKDLAKELGISQAYLSDVLAGKRGIGDAIVRKLGYELCYKKVNK